MAEEQLRGTPCAWLSKCAFWHDIIGLIRSPIQSSSLSTLRNISVFHWFLSKFKAIKWYSFVIVPDS